MTVRMRVFVHPDDPTAVYVARRVDNPVAQPEREAVPLGRQADGSIVARVAPGRSLLGLDFDALRARVGQEFALDIAGHAHPARLIGLIHEDRAGLDNLVFTDIAQAQEWLGMAGRLSRIDVRVHAANFGSLPGGFESETVLQRPPTAPARAPQVDPGKTDPGIFSDVLPRRSVGEPGLKISAATKFDGATLLEARANPKLAGVKVTMGGKLAGLIADFKADTVIREPGPIVPGTAADPDPVLP